MHPGSINPVAHVLGPPITGRLVGLLAFALVILPGCGAAEEETVARTRKQLPDKKEQRDYEVGELVTLPSDDTLNSNYVKPGHAVTAVAPATAHRDDLRGEFQTSVTDAARRPIPEGETGYHVVYSRPAVLPQGQTKFLESTFSIPVETGSRAANLFLQQTLRVSPGARMVDEDYQVTRRLVDYQYLFPVLSTDPGAYGYLKQLASIRPPFDELVDDRERMVYYRVIIPEIEQRVPLSSHPFAWTSIAYLLWDGVPPGLLARDQQQAMLDWLHWGGQLIISGPGSLEQLTNSFLEPYLPARATGAVPLGAEAFAALQEHYSPRPAGGEGEAIAWKIDNSRPLVGVGLALSEQAEYLPGSGNLVAERRVGRGRIVVTTFSLSERDVIQWRSFDSFFNAGLLRRPPRRYEVNRRGAVRLEWVDQVGGRDNPLYVTATRYLTRDVGSYPFVPAGSASSETEDWHWDGCEPLPAAGLGGWNDQSGPSRVARDALREAAGIAIPPARFVLTLLAVYLIVLVPVNWTFFRLLGRVEWAWGAAPVIAVVGALVVIRLAQLDVGFVRSRTEIAVLEMHAGYPRTHLTRYTALYTSLSSRYELQFADLSAMAQPCPPSEKQETEAGVTLRRDRDVRLSGFLVRSNTTGFLHSEEMFDAGGTIELVGDSSASVQLHNGSRLDLHHVGVVRRLPDGAVQTGWLDQLPARSTAALEFLPAKNNAPWLEQWELGAEEEPARGNRRPPAADLEDLTELAIRGAALRPGDARLVAWMEGPVPGLTIEPAASQTRAMALVLVHLRRGPLPSPRGDANSPGDAQPNADPR